MRLNILMAGLCLAAVPVAVSAAPQSTQAERYITIDGVVLRYEPGRVIVVRGADNREVIYNLSSGIVVPEDVRVGRQVTLYTEPAIDGGTQMVKRVTTTTMGSDGKVRSHTEDTRTLPSGATSTRTVMGDVIRYDPGRVIVVRGSDDREVSYNLNANVTVPDDVRVGRHVTLYTEPGPHGGTQVVSRVTSTSITPEGNVRRTTEDTRTTSSRTSTTTTTMVTGRVHAYVPGKTLTLTRADGTQATYIITGTSTVPADLALGKSISIVPVTTVDANGNLVVRTITYVNNPR